MASLITTPWVLWLAAPVAATALAAVWAWWRGWLSRPRRLSTPEAMRAHEAYLAALTVPPRNGARRQVPSPTASAHTAPGDGG